MLQALGLSALALFVFTVIIAYIVFLVVRGIFRLLFRR